MVGCRAAKGGAASAGASPRSLRSLVPRHPDDGGSFSTSYMLVGLILATGIALAAYESYWYYRHFIAG